jgi:hypothetical protein
METFAEGISAMIAVVFSVACGLLVEELLFGGLIRLFFALRPDAAKASQTVRKYKGERTCSR